MRLASAFRRLAATLPPPPLNKVQAAEQERRDIEELCVDLALGCLSAEGGAGAAPEEARARLAWALAMAVRPPRETPELSKDAKAAVKKQRHRVRTAILALLRVLQPAVPAAPAAAAAVPKAAAAATAPKPEAVKAGTELLVAEEGTVFVNPTSDDFLGVVAEGTVVIASGAPVEVEGFHMVPIKPKGAVELRVLRAVAAAPAPAPAAKAKAGAAAKGGKGSGAAAKSSEPELEGRLAVFVRLAALGTSALESAEDDFLQACYGGFDPQAALCEAEAPKAKADAPAEMAKEPSVKAGKKAAKGAKKEEDLDSLLAEFGATPSPTNGKKKGKK